MTHHFTTTLTLSDETEVEVAVTYTYYKGWGGGSHAESPPEPASVEIQSVVPDVPAECYDAIIEECFEDHANYLADAAEWKADMRRDDYE